MPDPSTPPNNESQRAGWAREVRTRLAALSLSPTREAEIVDELSQHLDDRYAELIGGGASADEATRLTLAEFRSANLLAQYMAPLRQSSARPLPTPGAATGYVVADLWQDLRYAARTFSRQPGFAIAAVFTLALGIGASSAIFSVVHGVLLESLPFTDADRLYRLRMVYPNGAAYTTLSAPDFMSVREKNRVFDKVEAYTTGAVTMLGGAEPIEVRVASISDDLFGLLGLPVVLGRGFLAEENAPGRNGSAILDYGFWQRAFGGDSRVIGRAISVGGISVLDRGRAGAGSPAAC